MATPVDAVKAGLASLYKSADFADCTIICGPHHFKVHKNIVAMHSEYFKVAFKSKFKEGQSGTIELKSTESEDADEACDDPEIVKLMINYFYHLDYKPSESKAVGTRPSLPTDAVSFLDKVEAMKKKGKKTKSTVANSGASRTHLIEHAEVFAIAVKYQVDALRALAVEKFKEGVASYWNHVEFAEAVLLAYTTTPEDVKELRDCAAETIDKHDELLKKPDIEKVVCSINGLAYEVLKRGRDRPKCDQVCGQIGKTYACHAYSSSQPCKPRTLRCSAHARGTASCGHSFSYCRAEN